MTRALDNSVCNNVLHEHHRSQSREIFSSEEFTDTIPDPAIGAPDAIARRQIQETVRQILNELLQRDRCLLKDSCSLRSAVKMRCAAILP
jgi:hypothetical protein